MLTTMDDFGRMVSHRLSENTKSFKILFEMKHYGNCLTILKQQLDQLVRLLYLINRPPRERAHLINLTLNSQKWFVEGPERQKRHIDDKAMIEFAGTLTGWERSICDFSYSFLHLSNNYNYLLRDPIVGLKKAEKAKIGDYIRQYHREDLPEDFVLDDVIPVIKAIFERIAAATKDCLSRM